MNDNKFHRKIKQQLDEHEFDFNPQAWENMRSLLDNEPRKPKHFFTFKIWLAMITGLFVLLFLFLKQD
ncbi:MAG: hypothetical protein AAB316_03230, partial [Bacteroidota bacterium]